MSLPVLTHPRHGKQERPAAFPRPIHPYRPPVPHAVIERVEPGSLGESLGLLPGDELLSINGERLEDVIDYRFLIAEEEVELEIAPSGRPENAYRLQVRKDADTTLGVTFRADVFDGIRTCTNNCDFCFVYQNRRRMRRSVYIKDDDYRLSFLHGDFITLTNLTERCWDRIFHYHLSPLFVSIHATDPAVRAAMLRNEEGARLREHLDRLFAGGIEIHGQIVLTPGFNDGPVLERTVRDMAALHGGQAGGGCRTLAIVPVGLTGHRERLPALRCITREEARAVVQQAELWQAEFLGSLGTRFVFPSDELYLLAGLPFPRVTAYEGLPQVENGVGMVARLRAGWRSASRRLPVALPRSRSVTVVTGTLAAPILAPMVARLDRIDGLRACLLPIPNAFFGESVTVAGLLAGEDIAAHLQGRPPGDAVLVPEVALRDGYFIDDWSVAEVQAAAGCPVVPVPPNAGGLISGALGAG